MSYVEYRSNNSGGDWWLTDDDWFALEKAGWEIEWSRDTDWHDDDGRWLGALATRAVLRDTKLEAAIAAWESVTNERANAPGCRCCGQPHDFTEYTDDDQYVDSGPYVEYPSYSEDD